MLPRPEVRMRGYLMVELKQTLSRKSLYVMFDDCVLEKNNHGGRGTTGHKHTHTHIAKIYIFEAVKSPG